MEDEKQIKEEYNKAVAKALRLLQHNDRTVFEIRTRLKDAEFSEDIVDRVIEYLIKERFLNDTRYAEYYVVCYKGKRSSMRIRRDLTNKGVDSNIIDIVMEECDDSGALEKALRKQLFKYGIESVDDVPWDMKQKISAALYRQGFRPDDIGKLF